MAGDINIFYSWQSDLEDKTNKIAIRDILQIAKNKIEHERKINIIIDEAIRNKTGSPNISLSIIEKINASDIFVCDISTINKEASEDFRKVPNPNVMYELGYAVSKLGWEKILLIYNKEYGSVEDIPFDIRQHKAIDYKLSKQDLPNVKSIIGNKVSEIENQINLILDLVPVNINITDKKLLKKRDIKIINEIMKGIPYSLIKDQLHVIPHQKITDLSMYFDYFAALFNKNIVFINNKNLAKLFKKVFETWTKIERNSNLYHQNNISSIYAELTLNYQNKKYTKIIDSINEEHQQLDIILTEIITLIKKKYVEIDLKLIDETISEQIYKHRQELSEVLKKGKKNKIFK